ELGSRPRILAAEDFARAILVRKMEGDISRLEGLNSSNKPPATTPAWTTTQEPAPKKNRKSPRDEAGNAPAPSNPSKQPRPPQATRAKSSEQRRRVFLKTGPPTAPAPNPPAR